jgi:hypothetical protein
MLAFEQHIFETFLGLDIWDRLRSINNRFQERDTYALNIGLPLRVIYTGPGGGRDSPKRNIILSSISTPA